MLLLLSLACGPSDPPPPEIPAIQPDEAAAAATAVLCRAASVAGQPCAAEGATAVVTGDVELGVQVEVTDFLTLPSRSIGVGASAQQIPGEVQLGLKIALSANGALLASTEIRHAASDVDLTVARGAVLDGALQRWALGQGLAALDAAAGSADAGALGGVGMSVPPRDVAGARAWAGYPMLTGVGFDPAIAAKLGPNVGTVLAALGPWLEGLEDDALHGVQVRARLGGGGPPGPCGIMPPVAMAEGSTASIVPLAGEVLVDGQAIGDICALSEAVSWPLPKGGATLEWDQFAVVQRLPETPDGGAETAP